jgi:hypothetical protein
VLQVTRPDGLEPVVEAMSPVSSDDERLHALRESLSKLEDGPKSETQARVDDLLRSAVTIPQLGCKLMSRIMATKEAELRKTIDDQSGEIVELRKSNTRMKDEIFARVSLTICHILSSLRVGTPFTQPSQNAS